MLYIVYTAFSLPVITIGLVDGNAYGGGFECALAHGYIIASEDVKFGLPENKFNLLPGMGAYSLLNRKLSPVDANEIIRSGKVNKARYFESLGLIESVAERGEELKVLDSFIKKLKGQFNFEKHHIQCKKIINPLSKNELLKITNMWVDACMKLDAFDLRRMEILAKAQYRKANAIA